MNLLEQKIPDTKDCIIRDYLYKIGKTNLVIEVGIVVTFTEGHNDWEGGTKEVSKVLVMFYIDLAVPQVCLLKNH